LFRERFVVDAQRFMPYASACRVSGSANATDAPQRGAAYEIAPDRLVIVTVARITRRKGHSVTLPRCPRFPRSCAAEITWL